MATGDNIKGATGILSVKVGASYKPIVCLTNTSVSRTTNTEEKVNYCTGGLPVEKVTSRTQEVSFDAEIVDEGDDAGYQDLVDLWKAEEYANFKIEGRGSDKHFEGLITSLSDSFPGQGDATFSGTMRVKGDFATAEP